MPEGASTRTRLSPTTYHEWLWPSIAGRNTFAGVRTRLLLRRPTAADAASPAAASVAARRLPAPRAPAPPPRLRAFPAEARPDVSSVWVALWRAITTRERMKVT